MSPQLYNHLLVLLLLCVWLTYFSCHGRSEIDNDDKNIECVESERHALLEFKRGICVDRCGLLDSWKVTQDCCLWYGIQCHNNSGHVIALRIPTPTLDDYAFVNSCLNGTISASLLDLIHLKYRTTGKNLPFLHVLRLGDCNISLKLPPSLSYINSSTTLSILSLPLNNLNDTSIFVWLTNLEGVEASLVHLDLSNNQQLFNNSDFQQTGYIMNFLGNLCSLQTLQLYGTLLKYQFSDIIHSLSVCSHKSLADLDLSNNQVWGSIPDNIINLSYLRKLKVDDNMLSGTISQAVLGGLPMLEYCDIIKIFSLLAFQVGYILSVIYVS